MITFTRVRQSEDPETGTMTPVTTTITGSAIQVKGIPARYTALGLVLTTMPTLLFTPTTYGETPEPGDTVSWVGKTYTVKDVDPVAPDGITIIARIIIGR